MRFKEFLTEARGKTSLTEDEVIAQFKGDYSESLALITGANQIYRGIETGGSNSFFIYGAAEKNRKPLKGGREYTHFLDNNSLNQGWPKRVKSTICTTRAVQAASFGTVYVVFPKNGTMIGALMVPDMWQVKNKFLIKANSRQQNMSDVGAVLGAILSGEKLPATKNLNDKILKIMSKELADRKLPFKLGPEDLGNAEEVFSYKHFGAKLFSISKLANKRLKTTELWFEGEAMMIELSKMKFIQHRLMEEGLIKDGAF